MKKVLFIVWFFASQHLLAQNRFVDSLKQVVVSHPEDTLTIDALNYLATEYGRTDLTKMFECLYGAMTIARKSHTRYGISSTYSQLVTGHQNTGKADSARIYLNKLEQLAAQANTDKIKINYYGTAGLFYKNMGSYKEALGYMLKSLNLLTAKEFEVNRAGQLLNIGNTYSNLGDMKEAANYHIEALKLFEKLDNKRGQSFCLQSLGNDFLKLNDVVTARKYFEQSLGMKEALKDSRGKVTAWAALGQINRELKNYGEALKYLEKAREQAASLKLNSESTNVLLQLGLLEKNLGNVKKAQALLEESLRYARTTSDELTISKIETELQGLDDQSGHSELKNTLVRKVIASSASGDKQSEADAHVNLAEFYASARQYDKAYHHLQSHHAMKDSVQGSAVVLQLRELEKKYESERKESEIALLKKDQSLKAAIIAQQNSNLLLAIILLASAVLIGGLLINSYRIANRTRRQFEIEKMRNNIARDLHDDIGSTLSSINIMSKLALQSNGGGTQHLARIAENSSRMMENMSDIVWSINPEHDSLETVVVRMKEFAAEILENKNIAYNITGEEALGGLKIEVEIRKNLFLIFKEAINNAAKYSEASEILVTFSQQKNMLVLQISDNGCGFDPSAPKTGNGLKNMTRRADAVRGELTIKSLVNKGTTLDVRLPIT